MHLLWSFFLNIVVIVVPPSKSSFHWLHHVFLAMVALLSLVHTIKSLILINGTMNSDPCVISKHMALNNESIVYTIWHNPTSSSVKSQQALRGLLHTLQTHELLSFAVSCLQKMLVFLTYNWQSCSCVQILGHICSIDTVFRLTKIVGVLLWNRVWVFWIRTSVRNGYLSLEAMEWDSGLLEFSAYSYKLWLNVLGIMEFAVWGFVHGSTMVLLCCCERTKDFCPLAVFSSP